MAQTASKLLAWAGRLVKGLIAAALVPPLVGLVLGIHHHLGLVLVGRRSFADWIVWGAVACVGLHLFFCKPTVLFQLHHRLLSRLALWLFGGQVATVGPQESKGKSRPERQHGSTLVLVSPYLIPLYTVLVCLLSWLMRRWVTSEALDAGSGFLVGMSLCWHWVMAADGLQQDRSRLPFSAYLLALVLVGLISTCVVNASLSLAVPGWPLLSAFADGLLRAQAIYIAVAQQLFF